MNPMQMNPFQLLQQFQQFRQTFMQKNPNVNPQNRVQEMLNTGKMTQTQFEQCRKMANMLTGQNR